MIDPSDLSLLTQVTVFHNRRAFDKLVVKYQAPIRRFFLNQTGGDSQLSDDLAQDTFLKAYVNIRSFRGMASFQTWLMRIAYNVFYDHVRRESAKGGSTADVVSVESQAVANSSLFILHSSFRIDLYAALALLKPDERTCITLQLIDGYDIAQIARITEMKEGTVKSHLSRGKEKMANYLKKNGYDRR
jgi:RNA polymerase sigma-70 factor (ECF subfamily)